jgi:hypothetical protein
MIEINEKEAHALAADGYKFKPAFGISITRINCIVVKFEKFRKAYIVTKPIMRNINGQHV